MGRCLIALFGIVGCLVTCLGATPAAAERRVALVVGNGQYVHTSALPNPRNDAQDIADALRKVGFEVMVGYDLDQIRFARIIDDFARALEGADVGLFFYAGHGLQVNEKNYLVSTEARLESTFLVPSETIELDAIIRLMEAKTGTNLIFLDACRNNPLSDNLKRNLAAVNRAVTVGRGLARIEPTGRDTLVAFSAAPGQEATDGQGRNSPFAAALLRHLPKPGVEVSVMLKEVTADVRRETNNAQRPQQLSDMSKTFYFVKAEPAIATAPPIMPASPPASPPEPLDLADVAAWQSAAGANECESVRAYLRRFPNGRLVDLARIAENRLCKSGSDVALAPPQPPSPAPVGPKLNPGPGAVAAAPPAFAPAADTAMNTPVGTPAGPPQSIVPVAPPVAAPDAADIGRKLQSELIRVGCGIGRIETDGTWGAASRNALRSFNERTRSIAVVDRPTPEALTAVQGHRDRVCPVACEPGTELRGGACVAIPKAPERSRHAARPPERDRERDRQRAQRTQREQDSDREDAPSHRSTELDARKGESWIYVGKQRCKTYQPMGSTPRIICP